MRLMYDALNPHNIPANAGMVASYIDGVGAPEPGWESLFPAAVIVKIARNANTDDGHVGDCETGDLTPSLAVQWVQRRRSSGADPTVYCNLDSWPAVREAFTAAGVPEPHYWIAHWDGLAEIPPGAVAVQYAATGPYDLSVCMTPWPGVDIPAVPVHSTPVPPTPAGYYRVIEGDNLSTIAARHNVSLQALERANPSAGHPSGNWDVIYPGDLIAIPTSEGPPAPLPGPQPETYTVKPGDNMSAIAAAHGVTLQALEQANPRAGHPHGDYSVIWAGDVLVIPR